MLIFFTAVGCTSSEKKATAIKKAKNIAPIANYEFPSGFSIIDTGTYADELVGGNYAIISYKNNIDTIDIAFGVKKLANQFVYQTIHSYTDSALTPSIQLTASPSFYVITDGSGKRRKLTDLAPDFDDYFSSPTVIDDKVYYWQMHQADSSSLYEISAAQFSPSTSKTTLHFLFKDDIGTDDMNYFPCPLLKNNNIEFCFSDKQNWKFTKDFKIID